MLQFLARHGVATGKKVSLNFVALSVHCTLICIGPLSMLLSSRIVHGVPFLQLPDVCKVQDCVSLVFHLAHSICMAA